MKKQLFFFLFIYFSLFSNGIAQVDDNPIGTLSEKLLQNELLSNRFLRNAVFIKTNTFKKKALADMDKSLAKFDDNLSYVILHLPYAREIKDDYLKLQNMWNVYRLKVTDYENPNYKSLVVKTRKLTDQLRLLNKSILKKHKAYSKNKKVFEETQYVLENGIMADNIATAYVLKNGLNFPDAYGYFDIDFGQMKKNLKKLGKYEPVKKQDKDILVDLNTSIEAFESMMNKSSYNPKMMYSTVNSFSKKSFKLLNNILQNLK